MYYRAHLPSHFHAECGDEAAAIGIDPIVIIEGAAIHQAELRANCELARGHRQLVRIDPLD